MDVKMLARKHIAEAQTVNIAPEIDPAEQRYSIENRGGCSVDIAITRMLRERSLLRLAYASWTPNPWR